MNIQALQIDIQRSVQLCPTSYQAEVLNRAYTALGEQTQEVEKLKQDCMTYLHEVERLKAQQDGWIPVSERLPEGTVLASYTNNYNKSRIIRAKYVQKFTQESGDIDDFDAQYDEETDTYYDCEGWYEMIDNWDSYSSVAVTEGTVTHWMNLPAAPKVKP